MTYPGFASRSIPTADPTLPFTGTAAAQPGEDVRHRRTTLISENDDYNDYNNDCEYNDVNGYNDEYNDTTVNEYNDVT